MNILQWRIWNRC